MPYRNGRLAQLVEHCIHIAGVTGSSPVPSTYRWFSADSADSNDHTYMNKLLQFLKNNKVATIATADERGPWVANVYYAVGSDNVLYFVSPKDARHSEMILKNDNIAFSISWFDEQNHGNRKGVQGLGRCDIVKNPAEIITAIKALNEVFPDLKDMITVDWIKTNAWQVRVWAIQLTYIKYYDDEIYGEEESEEFNF